MRLFGFIIRRHRDPLIRFLLRPHNLKISASSLGAKVWRFEMSCSSCGLVTVVFFVSLSFGECNKKQCANDTWKIIALHESFHLSSLCSSNNNIIKVKRVIEQWWNDTDNEKPKCSEKIPRGLSKDPTMVFVVRIRRPTSWAVVWPEDWN